MKLEFPNFFWGVYNSNTVWNRGLDENNPKIVLYTWNTVDMILFKVCLKNIHLIPQHQIEQWHYL